MQDRSESTVSQPRDLILEQEDTSSSIAPRDGAPDRMEVDSSFAECTPLDLTKSSSLEGFGSQASGGLGGKVVVVTNLSTSFEPGSLRWALNQHPGEPLVIIPIVEGEFRMGQVLEVSRSDVTFEGRFAPGAGFWVSGPRWRIVANNIRFQHWMHLGNMDQGTADARCFSFGSFDTDPGSNRVYENIVLENTLVANNRVTGAISFNPRGLDQATGETIRNISILRSIVTRPSQYDSGVSANLIFIGDGVDGLTLAGNLLSSGRNRHPGIRSHNHRIEISNNVIYNWGNAALDLWSSFDRISVRNNVFKLGPMTGAASSRILVPVQPRGRITFSGNITPLLFSGNFEGGSNTGWSITETVQWPASGWPLMEAGDVEGFVAVNAGPLGRGGRREFAQRFSDEMIQRTGPPAISQHPGLSPIVTHQNFYEHSDFVPLEYLKRRPEERNLEMLVRGSNGKCQQVWERVAEWIVAN